MDGDEEEFWTFSAQTMIATLVAFLTCVMWNALRQVKLFNTAAPARTVERGTQSELDSRQTCIALWEVNAITCRGCAKGCITCR